MTTTSEFTTITLSPAIDYHVTVALNAGCVCRAQSAHPRPGGKGLNASVVLHRLTGRCPRTVVAAGGAEGAFLTALASQAGLALDVLPITKSARINCKCADTAGTTTDINAPAPALLPGGTDTVLSLIRGLPAGSWLVLGGTLPPGAPVTFYHDAVAAAHAAGVLVALDTSGPALAAALPAGPDLIKPNVEEMAEVLGVDPASLDVVAGAQAMQGRGARTVLVSAGGDGGVLVGAEGGVWRAAAPKVKVITTVGAGDSMLAGYLFAVSRGDSAQEALNYAVATGSAAVQAEWLPEACDVEKCLKMMKDM